MKPRRAFFFCRWESGKNSQVWNKTTGPRASERGDRDCSEKVIRVQNESTQLQEVTQTRGVLCRRGLINRGFEVQTDPKNGAVELQTWHLFWIYGLTGKQANKQTTLAVMHKMVSNTYLYNDVYSAPDPYPLSNITPVFEGLFAVFSSRCIPDQ